jgi:hypothetical protein
MERMDTDRTEQLALLVEDIDDEHRRAGWKLDEATRTRGRQGVAAARHALAEAARRRAAAQGDASRAA